MAGSSLAFDTDVTAALVGVGIYVAWRTFGWVALPTLPPPSPQAEPEADKKWEDTPAEGFPLDAPDPLPEPGAEPEPASLAPVRSATAGGRPVRLLVFVLLATVAVVAAAVAASWSVGTGAVHDLDAVGIEVDDVGVGKAIETAVDPQMVVGAAAAQAAEPFGARPPLLVDLTRQRMSVRRVNNQLHYKSAYYGTLRLGTPAQNHTFVFDTGSGHLIVPSAFCRSETCKAHKRYRRSASESALDIDSDGSTIVPGAPRDQITVSFGTGEVTGVFVEDIVCLDTTIAHNFGQSQAVEGSPSELPPGCINLRIVAATEMTEDPFSSFVSDGVLGLGLPSLSQTPEFNFMHVIGKSFASESPWSQTFGIFLSDQESQLALGGWDDDRLNGELYWNPVHRPELGHWMLRVKSLRVDGVILDFCKEGCHAVVDTGTSLMAVPTAVFSELYELMKHSAQTDGECRGRGPQLHFELENFTVSMGPEDYSRPEWYKDGRETSPSFSASSDEGYGPTRDDMYCRPMLMTLDLPEPVGPKLFILGEPALKKYYTVYDGDAQRVGIGRAATRPGYVPQPAYDDAVEATDDGEEWWYGGEE